MFLLFSKVVTLVYENCLGCFFALLPWVFVALSLEFFDMITEDNDFIMKYDTYFFISNILMLISKRLLTFAEFILN